MYKRRVAGFLFQKADAVSNSYQTTSLALLIHADALHLPEFGLGVFAAALTAPALADSV